MDGAAAVVQGRSSPITPFIRLLGAHFALPSAANFHG